MATAKLLKFMNLIEYKTIMQESVATTVGGWQNLSRNPRMFCGTSRGLVSHKPYGCNQKYAEQGSIYCDSFIRSKQLEELGTKLPALHS
jgi:hypothetical protein